MRTTAIADRPHPRRARKVILCFFWFRRAGKVTVAPRWTEPRHDDSLFDMTANRTVFVTLSRRARSLALSFACFLTATLHAQSPSSRLSPVEQRIRNYVRAHQAEQVDFLEKAVNISSGT